MVKDGENLNGLQTIDLKNLGITFVVAPLRPVACCRLASDR